MQSSFDQNCGCISGFAMEKAQDLHACQSMRFVVSNDFNCHVVVL